MSNPMGQSPHLPADYLERLATTRTGIAAEYPELFSPARPALCECDRFKHERTPCNLPPQDHGSVVSSPALCTACLFYCWADE